MTGRSIVLGALVAGCLLSGAAQSAIVTYTDRATWLAAVGLATGAENFNGFVVDADFDGTSVPLSSGMSIGTLAPVGEANVIRTPPQAAMSIYNIDGSAYAVTLPGGGAADAFPFVGFGAGTAAFGADFMDLNDGFERTTVQLFDGAALLATLEPPVEAAWQRRFWGFAATAGEIITEIRFHSLGPLDIFGMDNIEIAATLRGATDVPEPETLVLLGLSLAGAGLQLRRRSRAA